MKLSTLSKTVGASVLALSLAVLPSALPVSAQTNDTSPAPGTTEGGGQMQGTDSAETGDRDFDWGWLGLIGLAGLAGLSGKREEPTRYRDPGATGTH